MSKKSPSQQREAGDISGDPFLRIDYTESKEGMARIQIQMPVKQFDALRKVMQRPKTMLALCKASKTSGLEKVLVGSTWCAAAYPGGTQAGVQKHQFDSKNWFTAFWKAVWYCTGSSFQLYHSQCRIDSPYDNPIQYH